MPAPLTPPTDEPGEAREADENVGSPAGIFDAECRVGAQQRELMAKAQRWQALDQVRQREFATSGSPMDTLPDDIVAQIFSRLRARDLGRLACTCRRFVLRLVKDSEPSLPLLSLVHEGARRSLQRRPQMLAWVPRRGSEPWLELLGEAEALARPATFELRSWGADDFILSRHCLRPLDYAKIDQDTFSIGTTFRGLDGEETGCYIWEAAASGREMRAGVHHAQLQVSWTELNTVAFTVGVVAREDLSEDGWGNDDLWEERADFCGPPFSRGAASDDSNGVRAWGWSNIGESIYPDGTSCDLWNDENTYAEDSEDIIGLTLDVGAGTLTAKRGGEELGTVACGLPRGEAFVWFADMLGENRDEEDEAEPFSASVTFV